MLKLLNDKLVIVVASCRKYDDAWKPFAELLHKYWPDCEYRLALLSDDLFLDEAFSLAGLYNDIIPVGQDQGWIKNLLVGLNKLDDEVQNVLLMQEDFFISGQVDAKIISEANWIVAQDPKVSCARLMPCPGADFPILGLKHFGLLDKQHPYIISCQAAIWKKQKLISLLISLMGMHSAAEFEIFGSKLRPEGDFLSVYRNRPFPLPYLVSAISRGKWNPDAIKLCRENNIAIDVSKRPIDGLQV